ncbi:MAG: NTP transferase domain-containing protein, partial [Gemmatimonadetes bacterium]|nr:NTP transferase domain-containing protein [Gemmatimonadota bacterium]
MKLLGVRLAGGSSRRFGSPKALARLHGTPLWSLGLDALKPCDGGVVAIANEPEVA